MLFETPLERQLMPRAWHVRVPPDLHRLFDSSIDHSKCFGVVDVQPLRRQRAPSIRQSAVDRLRCSAASEEDDASNLHSHD